VLETRNGQGMVEWIVWKVGKNATGRDKREFSIVSRECNTGPWCSSKAPRVIITAIEVYQYRFSDMLFMPSTTL
jgi:hypothetical protein